MPQFDQMQYDQKWSVWDTWKGVGRNIRVYAITAATKITRTVTGQNRRAKAITAQNRRGKIITSGG